METKTPQKSGGFFSNLFDALVDTAAQEIGKVADTKIQALMGQVDDELKIGRFIAYNNGTALDNTTGLTWCRYAIGQSWDSGMTKGDARKMNWNHAVTMIESINSSGSYSGFYDWRLPTQHELESIWEQGRKPAINTDVFQKTPYDDFGQFFWSSTSTNPLIGRAMYVLGFGGGPCYVCI